MGSDQEISGFRFYMSGLALLATVFSIEYVTKVSCDGCGM